MLYEIYAYMVVDCQVKALINKTDTTCLMSGTLGTEMDAYNSAKGNNSPSVSLKL